MTDEEKSGDRPKLTYSEFSFYSPILDSQALRISVSDGRNGEYFAVISKPPIGKSLREAREKALSSIEAVIEAGFPPCEVLVRNS